MEQVVRPVAVAGRFISARAEVIRRPASIRYFRRDGVGSGKRPP